MGQGYARRLFLRLHPRSLCCRELLLRLLPLAPRLRIRGRPRSLRLRGSLLGLGLRAHNRGLLPRQRCALRVHLRLLRCQGLRHRILHPGVDGRHTLTLGHLEVGEERREIDRVLRGREGERREVLRERAARLADDPRRPRRLALVEVEAAVAVRVELLEDREAQEEVREHLLRADLDRAVLLGLDGQLLEHRLHLLAVALLQVHILTELCHRLHADPREEGRERRDAYQLSELRRPSADRRLRWRRRGCGRRRGREGCRLRLRLRLAREELQDLRLNVVRVMEDHLAAAEQVGQGVRGVRVGRRIDGADGLHRLAHHHEELVHGLRHAELLHAVRTLEVCRGDEADDFDRLVGRRVPLAEPVVAVLWDVLLLLPHLSRTQHRRTE